MNIVNENGRHLAGRKRSRADDCGGLALSEIAAAFGAIDERDFAGADISQRRSTLDHEVFGSNNLAVDQKGQFGKRRLHDGFLSLCRDFIMRKAGAGASAASNRQFSEKAEELARAIQDEWTTSGFSGR
jgi:hypothetical protein